MPHSWYMYVFWLFEYGDLLWPDLDFDPTLVSSINPISSFVYDEGVFGESFGTKLLFLRSLRPATWKSSILTSFRKFMGRFKTVSSRAFERRVARFAAISRSRVRQGGVWRPPANGRWLDTSANAGLKSGLRTKPDIIWVMAPNPNPKPW